MGTKDEEPGTDQGPTNGPGTKNHEPTTEEAYGFLSGSYVALIVPFAFATANSSG